MANNDTENENVHVHIPPRYFLLPGTAVLVGSVIGLLRGSRHASLRFLAENAHRPPTTVQGWYFYKKTKNYRVILGGLKGAGIDGSKLALTATGWVVVEEGLKRVGLDDVHEVGAGLGTAGVFAAVYRLPWKATRRTLMLGLMMGSAMRLLRWGRDHLQEQVRERSAELEKTGATSQEEAIDGTDGVPGGKRT